ncbi:MAG: hypothetical protein ABJA57_06180 [Ginsengibacter sp.]
MNNDLVSYIERIELIAFFAGYPLIYSLVIFFAGEHRPFANRLKTLLPFGYALTATLFLGIVLKDNYPGPLKNIPAQLFNSYWRIWGILALLFWIPAFGKNPVFSLLHSLVFFFLLLYDLFMISSFDNDLLKNDMKIYTVSLLLNSVTLAIILLVDAGRKRFRIRT